MKRLFRYIVSLFKKNKKETVIEIEATGCIPAASSDCIDHKFRYKSM